MTNDTTPASIGADALRKELIADLREVFDASGQETPQIVRDVIEYADSWLRAHIQMGAESAAAGAAHPEAPAAQRDALPREDFAWMVVQEACETEPADEDDPECIRILRRDLKSAVLAALLRHGTDAARSQAKEGDPQ